MSKASDRDLIRKRLELSKKKRLIKKQEPELSEASGERKAKRLIHMPADALPFGNLYGKSVGMSALASLIEAAAKQAL